MSVNDHDDYSGFTREPWEMIPRWRCATCKDSGMVQYRDGQPPKPCPDCRPAAAILATVGNGVAYPLPLIADALLKHASAAYAAGEDGVAEKLRAIAREVKDTADVWTVKE